MVILSTFSIVAKDDEGNLGIAVSTAIPCVGALCPYVERNIGAIASQARVNTKLGSEGLIMLKMGTEIKTALDILLNADSGKEERQLIGIDALGRIFGFTGSECIDWCGHFIGRDFAVAGNLLIGEETLIAMKESFSNSEGDLAGRLISVLEAGQEAGGDKRGRVSAAVLVKTSNDIFSLKNDIRVDQDEDPVKKLREIYDGIKSKEDSQFRA